MQKTKQQLNYEFLMLQQKLQNTVISHGINSEKYFSVKKEIENKSIELKQEIKRLEDKEPETYLTIIRDLHNNK